MMPAVFDPKSLAGRVLDAVFPLECLACGAPGAHACAACLLAVAPAPHEPTDPRPLASAVGAFAYAVPLVRTLLADFKYRGYGAAGIAVATLARRGAAACAGRFVAPEAVVAVPLHERRSRSRGFNQAETVAAALAAAWGVPMLARAASRTRDTPPQAGPGTDRAKNPVGAFTARASAVRGKRLVLADDVWTTGATMKACAEALLAAGASEVRGFSLAWGSGKKENAGT